MLTSWATRKQWFIQLHQKLPLGQCNSRCHQVFPSIILSIFQETGTSTSLVQCDLCNKYFLLTKHNIQFTIKDTRGVWFAVQDQNDAAHLSITTPSQSQLGMTFINSFLEPRFTRNYLPITNSASPSTNKIVFLQIIGQLLFTRLMCAYCNLVAWHHVIYSFVWQSLFR